MMWSKHDVESIPDDPGMIPGAPESIPDDPGMIPDASGSIPDDPGMIPEAPESIPDVPGMIPDAPESISDDPGMISGASGIDSGATQSAGAARYSTIACHSSGVRWARLRWRPNASSSSARVCVFGAGGVWQRPHSRVCSAAMGDGSGDEAGAHAAADHPHTPRKAAARRAFTA
jgi:hypothetical protein